MAIIEARSLRKTYPAAVAVADVTLEIEEGEIFGVLGPNGSGKTTTVECVAGLRSPDDGTVRVAGLDPIADHDRVSALLGVQLQHSELQPKLTVREALELYASFYSGPVQPDEMADRVGLGTLLHRRFGTLSGGQKQRLFIALALIGNPRVVILDELTTGLDPRARRDTWSLVERIRDDGVTVVLVTHLMEEAQRLCDRVAILDAGRVVTVDTPAGVVRGTRRPTEMSFAPSTPLDLDDLRALPAASDVREAGSRIVLTGTDDTVTAAVGLLAQRGVVAHQLRVVDASLDDAYLDLTAPTTARG